MTQPVGVDAQQISKYAFCISAEDRRRQTNRQPLTIKAIRRCQHMRGSGHRMCLLRHEASLDGPLRIEGFK